MNNKEYLKEWRKKNPGYMKKWREKNPEKQKVLYKEYQTRKKEMISLRKQKHREANIESYRDKNRKWQKENKELACFHSNKYRSAKLNRMPKWLTQEQIVEIKNIYNNCPKGFHVDHIIPLQGKTVSGLHVPWNLRIISAKENYHKSNKLLEIK